VLLGYVGLNLNPKDLKVVHGRDCSPHASRHGYRGTSLRRKRPPPGPYRRPMPRVLVGS